MSAADPASLDDTVMQARFREIVRERDIKCIVETGVMHGLSTVILSQMVDTVFAIDNEPSHLQIADRNLRDAGRGNAVLCYGDSPRVLRALAPVLPRETLYFLDAHWGLGDPRANLPVLAEIDAIARNSGVIVLHDVRVPGRGDTFNWNFFGVALDYGYAKNTLSNWAPQHTVQYNTHCEGIPKHLWRGAMYVFPE